AVVRDEVDDDRVAVAGRPALDRDQLADRALQRLELGLNGLLRHIDFLARYLERRPVGRLGLRLHLDGGREAPVLLLARRQLVLLLRRRDRVDARAGRGVPEPAADVALDRLAVEAVLADALEQDRHGHLALAEARDPDRRSEVAGGV